MMNFPVRKIFLCTVAAFAVAISAIGLTENIPAAPFLAEYGSGHCSTHSDDNAPGSEDLHSFQGLIAHNALKGTTEQIHTTDRQVIVYRNSFPNSGYNVISSKRPVSISLKWSPDKS